MRLVSFTRSGTSSWGTLDGEQIKDLGASTSTPTLGAALRGGDIATLLGRSGTRIAREDVHLLPPIIDAGKIICIGLNYADHIKEMNRPWPSKPVVFTRFNDTLVGDGEALVAPRNSTAFDYEGEFAVVIGGGGRHIEVEDALNHVLGYTIMNDGSLRDYQRHTHQFTPGKNFPRSGGLGPVIVTADEFGAIGTQRITTAINGEIVQDSTLDQLVFGVAELVAYCSEWTHLAPGDTIATGTPGGVADGHDPARWLFPGDVVDVAVDGIGTLSNPVVEED